MDEDVLKDLAADELATQLKEEQKAAKKIRKEQDKIRLRIVAEKKAQAVIGKGAKGGSSTEDDEDLDENDFRTLASNATKSKKK